MYDSPNETPMKEPVRARPELLARMSLVGRDAIAEVN
jgi:hypothetical protein